MIKNRINILNIKPVVQNGKYHAKATTNELIKISASVFFENVKDILSVYAIVNRKKYKMELTVPGRDIYSVNIPLKKIGCYEYYIEASITHYKETLTNNKVIIKKYPKPFYKSTSSKFPLIVERKEAVFGSWYEIFIRNYGAKKIKGKWISGTLKNAKKDLKRIAKMGFTIVYMTPISPIGYKNRKGKQNSLISGPNDPGSPYSIGNNAGGHIDIDKNIGTVSDFNDYINIAKKLGIEVAYDIALQCSPDHPWVKKHPEWFKKRNDGTIAYAENPPKKYQDIYPLFFDNDYKGLYKAIYDIFDTWANRGIRIFRVDNPHTKPIEFWEQLISDLREKYPTIVFLSEAKTQPEIMKEISALGFSQSYTYFPWRNTKKQLIKYYKTVFEKEYLLQRPSFWQNTPDELLPYMAKGGINAFIIRAALAGFSSPSYGVLSGYELVENIMRKDGTHEFEKNDKYEYVIRNFYSKKAEKITKLLTFINEIRSNNSEFSELNNMLIHTTSSPTVFCFSKAKNGHNIVDKRMNNYLVLKERNENELIKKRTKIILINTNPFNNKITKVTLKGFPKKFMVKDLETNKIFEWKNSIRVNQFRIFECYYN